ncbi:MAG: hypothetical protein ACKOX6_12305 [Bdellovibrio sp.]
METTGAAEFRAQMKEYLDMADTDVVKVNRPGGKSVVILSSQAYEEIMLELAELRGVNKGLLAVAEGKVTKGTTAVKGALRETMNQLKAEVKKKNKKAAAG